MGVTDILKSVFDRRQELVRARGFCYRVRKYFGLDPVVVAEAIKRLRKRCLANTGYSYTCEETEEINGIVIIYRLSYTNYCGKMHGIFKHAMIMAMAKEDYNKYIDEWPYKPKMVYTELWCG